ncbi:arginine transporter [Methyloceanibacter stevinii]|uniref:Arginine transporter n=1 Tax=Methyloceanibacter stevinii TaxID=1774970 RepID=A0A1E3VTQ3_9HYPH|nr:methylmalonyl Co-A mutase-associated GTPase MeaB [Methyloceanibacter stevinii]ODR96930.1 arginine transporter [Methyloceanibacter stevinii]
MTARASSSPGAASARPPQSIDEIAAAIRGGDRVALGRAITLIESTRPEDQARARELLKTLLPDTGKAIRIGISGPPGAGKSTLIDQFGLNLIEAGHKVAVLAVDPTSSRTGGSILGDKTRMGRLASETDAFIRPSPAGSSLGGVTKTTRETIAIAEAAGFDVVLVRPSASASETAVSNMVDVFVVVAIPGAGDELQGIKRGLLELADIIAVNKADSDNVERANRAAAEYRAALHILASGNIAWQPAVLTMSARDNTGLDTLWEKIGECRRSLTEAGVLDERRAEQAATWMREIFEQRLLAAFKGGRRAAREYQDIEDQVRAGTMSPAEGADALAGLVGLNDTE